MAMRENGDMTNKAHNPEMIDRSTCIAKLFFPKKCESRVYPTTQATWMKIGLFGKSNVTCIWFMDATFVVCTTSCQCQNKLSAQSIRPPIRYPINDSIFRGIHLRRGKYTNKFRIGWKHRYTGETTEEFPSLFFFSLTDRPCTPNYWVSQGG